MADLRAGLAREDVPCPDCGGAGEYVESHSPHGAEVLPCHCDDGDGRPAVLLKIAEAIRQEWWAEIRLFKVPGAGDGPEDVARWLEEEAARDS